jgi:excisionase family DNA binding protein
MTYPAPLPKPDACASPWLTVLQAAKRAQCSDALIYRVIRAGKLKAARLGERRELRIKVSWLDAWIESTAEDRRW